MNRVMRGLDIINMMTSQNFLIFKTKDINRPI